MDNATGAPRKRKVAARRPISLAAEAAFRERLARFGAELLEPGWLGGRHKHHVRCAAGHDCYPRPNDVIQGHGPCRTCAGQDSAAAWEAFRKRLSELGAELIEPSWLGSDLPHRVRCAAGHDCSPMPASIQQGQGVCGICAGNKSAESEFRARVEALGGAMLGTYVNNKVKVHVRCPEGHDSHPVPQNIFKGGGICRTCSRKDPAASEAAFLKRIAELGATPMYDKYRGALKPHHVRCSNGHDCYSRPADVGQGDGICTRCAHGAHTVFYVLEHESRPAVKFGITARDGRKRLRFHQGDGFTTARMFVTGLPDGVAADTEKAVIAALALAGDKPVRGREYFDISCLPLIIDVASGWLAA